MLMFSSDITTPYHIQKFLIRYIATYYDRIPMFLIHVKSRIYVCIYLAKKIRVKWSALKIYAEIPFPGIDKGEALSHYTTFIGSQYGTG